MLRDERLARKKQSRDERLVGEKLLLKWLREWPCDDLPAGPLKSEKKMKRSAHHGTEQVTAAVRRVLGRSYVPKIKTKASQKEIQEKKREHAEKMRRSQKEQEASGSKWKPGSRDFIHEERPRDAKQERERKKKMKERKNKLESSEEPKDQEEAKNKNEEQTKSQPTVSSAKSRVSLPTREDQSFSEESRTTEVCPGGGNECGRDVLADGGDNQEVNTVTDKLDKCQPTFPDIPDSTFPSNKHFHPTVSSPMMFPARDEQPSDGDLTQSSCEEEEEEYKDCVKTKVLVKRRVKKELPNLTDEEDVDIVETDLDGCQPTFPDLPDLTFPSNNHLQPPYHLLLQAKVAAKRAWKDQPDLTDDSEEENVNDETDQEEDSQPTFPGSPDLTFPSSNHLQLPYHLRIKAKVDAKRVRKSPTDLTDDSEEEEDLERSRSAVLGDLRGGGSSSHGTSLSFEEVFTMREMLRKAIQSTQLALRLDSDTPGDGNCFSWAVIQQCQRTSVKEFLRRQGKTITNFMQLKEDVHQFVLSRQHHPSIRGLKASFEQKQGVRFQEGKTTRGWSTYWEDMLKNGEWADDTFVQATALYLSLDIFLVIADSATFDRPIAQISGDIESREVGLPGRPTLLLGYISDKHYQSLVPQEEELSTTNPITLQALRTALDSVQLVPLEKGSEVG